MATRSFTDASYRLTKKEAEKFRNIMENKEKISIVKVENHRDAKSKACIKRLLGIKQ